MEQRHIPPQNGTMLDHSATKDCWCSPAAQKVYSNASSGRGGSHQGRKVIWITYRHQNEETS